MEGFNGMYSNLVYEEPLSMISLVYTLGYLLGSNSGWKRDTGRPFVGQ